MITIHIDYIDGTESSYEEGVVLQDNFTTNCLTFFSNNFTKCDNVVVVDRHGRSIDRNELMSNKGFRYTNKEMREAHNIYKMLVANSFAWKQPVVVTDIPKRVNFRKGDYVTHSKTSLDEDGNARVFKIIHLEVKCSSDVYCEIMMMSNGMAKLVKREDLTLVDYSN